MITLLCGHRGVGKTSLLKRIEAYRPGARVLDLDREIETRSRRGIPEIFSAEGEGFFRDLERATLAALLAELRVGGEGESYIALGAGFEGPLPTVDRVLWIRRTTDEAGRIFLDRPRLDASARPLDEYLCRLESRSARFRSWATEELELREGVGDWDSAEAAYFGGSETIAAAWDGLETLRTLSAREAERARWNLVDDRAQRGLRLELRSDLISLEAARELVRSRPAHKWLLSLRPGPGLEAWLKGLVEGAFPDEYWLDVDVSVLDGTDSILTGPFAPERFILSLHAGPGAPPGLKAACQRLEALAPRYPGAWLKLAWPTESFVQLSFGEAWRKQDPARRTFLPISADGRWSWYRLWTWRESPLRFVREGEGSAGDQPGLLATLAFLQRAPSYEAFLAVLGDPVRHSWSPVFHEGFAASKKLAFLGIRVAREELDATTLQILRELGLRGAAVTSPLKERAFELCDERLEEARRFESVNTWAVAMDGRLIGDNTDFAGLAFAVRNFDLRPETAVWGGGGTRAVLRALVPHASFYSARSGERLSGPGAGSPRQLVWACGDKLGAWPPDAWAPKVVFDLDYRENSLGREYALRVGARYVAGQGMFKRQAELQQVLWRKHLP